MNIATKSLCWLTALVLLSACAKDPSVETEDTERTVWVDNPPVYPTQTLPENLQWQTDNTQPVYASPQAQRGGVFRTFMLAFPLTLRAVGPDSNSSFRSFLDGNKLSLTSLHPDTEAVIPELATQWAYAADGKTVYYKLNPNARWSDGKPVVADDYLFALEFMRSKYIVAPWYNNYYTEQIHAVHKYDDYTISVTGASAKPQIDLHYYYNLSPLPRHFHRLDENWVSDYNWRIEPTTGPYVLKTVRKGKWVEFARVPDWWGEELRYFKHRFNVDTVRITVIRDAETAYRHFLQGALDSFALLLPAFWHDKAKGDVYDRGLIHKVWFYNDTRQPSSGMYLNQDYALLQDPNIRLGLAYSMNIDRMLNTVLRGDYQRLHNMHTGYGEYTNTEIRAREFDLSKADDYFSRAGWEQRGSDGIRVKDQQRLAFTVTYGAPHHTDRLVVLKEEAKKAGVELLLEQLDGSASFKKILEKKHQIAWMGWSTGFRPAYWQHFHSENAHKPQTNNITNTDNAAMDALIMQYRAETDGAQRATLARQLQQMIHDSAVYIPTYQVPYTRAAYWRWVKLPATLGTKNSDSLFSPFGSGGGLFWIAEDIKNETLAARKSDQAFAPVTRIEQRYKTE